MTSTHEGTQMSAYLDETGRPTLRFDRAYGYDVEEVWWALTGDVDPVPDESVVEAQAPYLLVCSVGDDVVRWQLQTEAEGCRVVLTHVIGDGRGLASGAARCHSALEQIADTLDGEPPTVMFEDLVRHYSTLVEPAA
jgi:hypothetical protein